MQTIHTRVVLRNTVDREALVEHRPQIHHNGARVLRPDGPGSAHHADKSGVRGDDVGCGEGVGIGQRLVEQLAEPGATALEQVDEVALDEHPFIERGHDLIRTVAGKRSLRHAHGWLHIDADEVMGTVAENVLRVLETHTIIAPPLGSTCVEQQLITRAEHTITTILHLDRVHLKIGRWQLVVPERQHTGMIAIDVDPVGG